MAKNPGFGYDVVSAMGKQSFLSPAKGIRLQDEGHAAEQKAKQAEEGKAFREKMKAEAKAKAAEKKTAAK
ncbi:MAG: hypothetical protein GX410_08815 [Elusimicrobia bacterium]|nr:hypothetical protein [Elusimicrobiota bacterium]